MNNALTTKCLHLHFLFFLSIYHSRFVPIPKMRDEKRNTKAMRRGIENNAYAKFWGVNKVHYGRYAIGEFREHKAREIVCKQAMVALFLLSIGR